MIVIVGGRLDAIETFDGLRANNDYYREAMEITG